MTSSTLTLTLIALAVFAAPAPTQGWWLFDWFNQSTPFWNGLKTTFANDGVVSWLPENVYNSTGYEGVPRTFTEAQAQGWVPISDSCDQDNNGQFFGYRFVANLNDTSIAVIFDVNGIVAGLQMNIPQALAKSDSRNTYEFDNIAMFQQTNINGVDLYTLTAYFVDPSTICSTGRSSDDLANQGTGTGLVFQNGPTPDTLIQAPQNRTDALAQGWSNNKCFVGMGVHNWYQQETYDQDNCNTIRPVFLLYTKSSSDGGGQLLGFGFQFIGKVVTKRYEQPPQFAVKMIVGDSVSQCLLQKAADGDVGVTTMHVYLIKNPLSQTCL